MGTNAQDMDDLPENTCYRNMLARIYYLTVRETLAEIYRTVNGSLDWTGTNWTRFVNCEALQRLVYDKMVTLSSFTYERIAYCDQVGELEEVILSDHVSVLCIPITSHLRLDQARGAVGDALGPAATIQIATRQFTKALMHMFLKDVLGMEFSIKGGTRGPFLGYWRINEKLAYERVS